MKIQAQVLEQAIIINQVKSREQLVSLTQRDNSAFKEHLERIEILKSWMTTTSLLFTRHKSQALRTKVIEFLLDQEKLSHFLAFNFKLGATNF